MGSVYRSDPDLADLRKPVRQASQRPEFLAASAAARDRERAAAATGGPLPPAFLTGYLPPPLPTRLKDVSNQQKRSDVLADALSSCPDRPELPPATPLIKPSSVRGKASLVETLMRRRVAASRLSSTAPREPLPVARGLAGPPELTRGNPDGELSPPARNESAAPASPSLNAEKVRRRIAAVRTSFSQAAAEKRLPRRPAFDLSESDEENGAAISAPIVKADREFGPSPYHGFDCEELYDENQPAQFDDDDDDPIISQAVDQAIEEYEGTGRLPIYDVDCHPEMFGCFQDPPLISTAYRMNYNTGQCLRSLFAWHNDSVEIWSLLGSAASFGYLCIQNISHTGSGLYRYALDSNVLLPPEDRHMIAGYCAAISTCCLASALITLLRPHKKIRDFSRLSVMEYDSHLIWLLAISSSIIHFSSYCDEDVHNFLLIGASVVTAVGISVPHVRYFRLGLLRSNQRYCSLVAFAMAVMILFALRTMDYDTMVFAFGDFRLPMMAACLYLVGLWLSARQCPESKFPYKFDSFGNSDQLLRWCQFAASCCVYLTLQQLAMTRAITVCERR